jgi:hypothetical protein
MKVDDKTSGAVQLEEKKLKETLFHYVRGLAETKFRDQINDEDRRLLDEMGILIKTY